MSGSDFANWWNQNVTKHEPSLVKWIKENPGLASVVFTPMVPMTFNSIDSFVDVARIGEGLGAAASDEATAMDIAKGIGTDFLRAISVIPFGKAPSMIVKIGLQRIAVPAVLFRSVRGGLCAPIAAAQAIRRAGQNVFMKLDDILIKTHGKKYADFLPEDLADGNHLSRVAGVLRELKIAVESRFGLKTFDEVAAQLKGADWRSCTSRGSTI